MKIKYKLNILWVSLAILFAFITYYMYSKFVQPSELNTVPLLALLPIIVTIYYIMMPLIDYVRVKDDKIFIHKSFVVFTHKVKIEDIHHCNLMRKDFVIFTNKEEVFPIHLDWGRKDEMIEFVEYIRQHCRIEDKEAKSFNIDKLKDLL